MNQSVPPVREYYIVRGVGAFSKVYRRGKKRKWVIFSNNVIKFQKFMESQWSEDVEIYLLREV